MHGELDLKPRDLRQTNPYAENNSKRKCMGVLRGYWTHAFVFRTFDPLWVSQANDWGDFSEPFNAVQSSGFFVPTFCFAMLIPEGGCFHFMIKPLLFKDGRKWHYCKWERTHGSIFMAWTCSVEKHVEFLLRILDFPATESLGDEEALLFAALHDASWRVALWRSRCTSREQLEVPDTDHQSSPLQHLRDWLLAYFFQTGFDHPHFMWGFPKIGEPPNNQFLRECPL